MQLISALLLLFSAMLCAGVATFILLWHRAHRKAKLVELLQEGIGHIGVSAVVEYPDTPQPLLALLEEEYPRSEAIIVTDLQYRLSSFGELIPRFHLVKVNHSHLTGVRSLYRSRHRAFRRVVMVDLPIEYRNIAFDIAKEVATYDYVLQLQGECVVARDTIAYCANIIASHKATDDISMRSFVGADVLLERSDGSQGGNSTHLLSDRVLAWRKGGIMLTLFVISLPAVILTVGYMSGSRAILFVAVTVVVAVVGVLYISCRVMAEKSLFTTLDTILYNFYRFLVDMAKKIHYLYKERVSRNMSIARRTEMVDRIRGNNRESL